MDRGRITTILAVVVAVVALGLLVLHYVETSTGGRSGQPIVAGEQGDAILAELQAIRALLEQRGAGDGRAQPGRAAAPAPAPAPAEELSVSIDGSPSLGDPNAPVVMVEFTDYQCPFCGRFHKQTFPEIRKKFIDTGKVRYVVRDLPLRFHANAEKAAQAAHCAAEQGDYWAMWDTLFANADALEAEKLPGYGEAAGLDEEKLRQCLDSGRHLETIRASLADAKRLGITGTPSFVIGKASDDGVVKGPKLVGARPYPAFEQWISNALDAAGT